MSLRFDETTHTYYYNDKVVPNVSTILSKTIFKSKYAGVEKHVLNAKAKWGSEVHSAIENNFYYGLDDLQYQKIMEYEEIKEDNFIIIESQEEQVFNKDLYYCGTYDMVALVLGVKSMLDIKTTYELDMEYLSWQLSMYYYAKKDFDIEKLYVIWLPKRKKGTLVEVKLKECHQIEWLMNEYKKVEKLENGN